MMAYNNYYPAPYQPMYSQNYNPYLQQQTQQAAQQQPQQIQNGGFISAPTEDFARNYPVAPGNSVSFRDEKLPYLYTKTMGFSALDRPVFEKFRLVREEDATEPPRNEAKAKSEELPTYALQSDLEALSQRVEALEADRPVRKVKKKEGADDE